MAFRITTRESYNPPVYNTYMFLRIYIYLIYMFMRRDLATVG